MSKGPLPYSVDFKSEAVNKYLDLRQYKIVFFGEQHNASFDPEIKYHLITDLNRTLGIRHIFMEASVSAAWHFNQYLLTGDTDYLCSTSIIYAFDRYLVFWKRLYDYNKTLPDHLKLVIHGVDFERIEVFKTIRQLSPAGAIPVSLRPVMDTITAHLADTPFVMYRMSGIKMIEFDNSPFINALRYIQAQLSANADDARAYFGANYPVIRDIAANDSRVVVMPKPRNKTMFRAMRRIVEEQQIDRFLGFFGSQHTIYTTGTSLAKAARRLPGARKRDILNIVEVIYNLRRSDGTPIPLDTSDKVISLNVNCKATLLPAHDVPGYHRKADFIIIADAGQ